MMAIIFTLVNLTVDLSYALINPGFVMTKGDYQHEANPA